MGGPLVWTHQCSSSTQRLQSYRPTVLTSTIAPRIGRIRRSLFASQKERKSWLLAWWTCASVAQVSQGQMLPCEVPSRGQVSSLDGLFIALQAADSQRWRMRHLPALELTRSSAGACA